MTCLFCVQVCAKLCHRTGCMSLTYLSVLCTGVCVSNCVIGQVV